jgi:predicted transcriptional regulator
VYDKNNIPLSDVVAQVLAQFAARENATVEDVIALARQLPGALSLAPQLRPAQMPTRVSDETMAPRPAVTMLKRHLKAEHGLTEGQYRAQFGLDEAHPLVAPNYSSRKAEYAKRIGLGKYAREDTPAQGPGSNG